jgi:uroporphyrinogen-III decarboxylase
VNSRERLLTALDGGKPDHVPCSFMLFFNLYERCGTYTEFVERQLEMGLDAFVHVGQLNHTLHRDGSLDPRVKVREWAEQDSGGKVFCRRLETPVGPLTGRIRQREGWPTEDDFPLMNDWLVGRAEEVLVKPETDLDKLPFLFGSFRDRDIEVLREEAAEAARVAGRHGLLQVGGWKGSVNPRLQVDPGVMGADAMAWLSGFESVMILSLTRPELIREYARIIHEWNLRQIEIYLEVTEAELIVRRGWYETTEFWTPETFRQVIAPTLRREAELVHQAGRKFGYIITSAFLPLLDDILGAGVDVLIGLDPKEGKGTDLREVKRRFKAAGRCLWGGVSGPMSVETCGPDETRAAVQEAISILGEEGGFILSPVDNIREDTENAWKNTEVFVETWKRLR